MFEIPADQLQLADILFSAGHDARSTVISLTTFSPYSHDNCNARKTACW